MQRKPFKKSARIRGYSKKKIRSYRDQWRSAVSSRVHASDAFSEELARQLIRFNRGQRADINPILDAERIQDELKAIESYRHGKTKQWQWIRAQLFKRSLLKKLRQFEWNFGNVKVSGERKSVQWSRNFGGLLKKGEKALHAHFDVFNPTKAGPSQKREAIESLDSFVAFFPVLRQQGLAGLYGDSKNTALVRYFTNPKHGVGRDYRVVVIKSPLMDRMVAAKRYRKGMQSRDLLSQYADLPTQRLVIRFL